MFTLKSINMSTCIVSAFYEIPSKASIEFYLPHVNRFFNYITQECVFFTNNSTYTKLEPIIVKYNKKNIHVTLLEFEELPGLAYRDYNFWKDQCKIDVEKYHTPELAIIWHNKSHLVKKATTITDHKYYIWCDSGCIRNEQWKDICSNFGHRNRITDNTISVQLLRGLPYNKVYFSYPDVYVAGAIMGGERNMWEVFIQEYEKTIDKYVSNSVCCNMDQYIIASSILSNPTIFTPVLYNHAEHGCPDSWFFFLHYL